MPILLRLFALTITLMFSISANALNKPVGLIDDRDNPFRLFVLFHDDVPESKRSTAYVENIRPFTTEFEKITSRKIHPVFDRSRPPYTNFHYKAEEPKAMFDRWNELTWNYRKERHDSNEFRFSRNDRVLLITNDFINGSPLFGGMGGIATQPGNSAIASLDFKQIVGHELGHTFNAVHEEGEVLYNGWWCETFMFEPLPLRSNCYVFSEGNGKRIKAYVDSLY
ncbi:hypothetical protein [Pseudomonas sp. B21-053]|uniref:hypothetical protein n=1 Tax=Pseudomonas sp. B21-053 TaxID=2895493 RepID=UPI00222E18FF|nr:hypothetical protein [Pseudomonas sp. B21-053]UZE11926.1 hypothetical protein LOY68_31505 [Pseudomonas sp. B21-053]